MRPVTARRLVAGLALLAASPASADSIRCAGGIVSTGDRAIDLLGKCGPATLTSRSGATTSGRRGSSAGGEAAALLVTSTVEVWSCDFGPDRFVRLARLEGGKVTAVETGGYGYAR